MTFILFIIFKVGDGFCIKFWCDSWCEGLPLKNIFLELYNIASNKDASVAELLLSSEANYHWNIGFTRPIQDWELESVISFMDVIYFGSWRSSGVDKICWKLSTRVVFDVHSHYRTLQPPSLVFFFFFFFFMETVVETISFIWTAVLGRILAIDNLRRQKVVVVDWC